MKIDFEISRRIGQILLFDDERKKYVSQIIDDLQSIIGDLSTMIILLSDLLILRQNLQVH